MRPPDSGRFHHRASCLAVGTSESGQMLRHFPEKVQLDCLPSPWGNQHPFDTAAAHLAVEPEVYPAYPAASSQRFFPLRQSDTSGREHNP